jgi:ribosomal protein S18 acetylase RimI-like enzyme
MAAALQSGLELVDLRRFSAADLDALLDEETAHWRRELDWDFSRSAELVRKFTDLRALSGAALVTRSGVVGYAYSVLEDHKGLVGDLYVRDEYRTPENEYRLLSQVLEELAATPYIRRVESQLILFGWRDRSIPRSRQLRIFERDFLEIDLDDVVDLLPAAQQGITIEPWAQHFQEAAAHLISSAYVGHVDSQINDQYRSTAGARRFLYNIVQYPGCGNFLQPASLAAFERETGWMCGMCLAGEVGSQVGHITQVCLARDVRGRKLGYEMMRQSLLLMRLNGYKRASLTVTSENRHALDMYLRLGFRRLRKFPAFVWDGL